MARIRTIKPEFFTSADIVSLTPLARLFYVSLWCESDREGRLVWKPATFKLRYLPGDQCDVEALGSELVKAGLIVLYTVDGVVYGEIPGFKRHQVINNRESDSEIPARPSNASCTREPRVKAEGRKEGREGKGTTRDASGFEAFWDAWPKSQRKAAREQCEAKWKAKGCEEIADTILNALESFKASGDWLKADGEFIPAPLVWLNQSRWEAADRLQTTEPGFI
jgi:hypothetical protein